MDYRLLQVISEIMASSHLMQPDELAPTVDRALSRLDMAVTVFIVDHEQVGMRPLPVAGRVTPLPVQVEGSVPGRAYTLVRPEPDPEHADRLWMPLIDGTERLGVALFELPEGTDPADPAWQQRCALLTALVAHLLTGKMPHGDTLPLAQRTGSMTVAAELMWRMLPPLTSSHERLALTAILQPCYDIGGDGYDYAVDGDTAWLVLLDAMGRGLSAGIACVVALSAIRAARRAGGDLVAQARAADEHLVEQFGPTGRTRFVTGLLAQFDLATGRLRYINAGSPLPMLLRDADPLGVLIDGKRPPLGLRKDFDVQVGEQVLQPGYRMLLHTDGVTEARSTDGSPFGAARLAELASQCQADGLPAPETLRRLARAVARHRAGDLTDDAAMVLVEWSPEAAKRTVPGPPFPAVLGEAEEGR